MLSANLQKYAINTKNKHQNSHNLLRNKFSSRALETLLGAQFKAMHNSKTLLVRKRTTFALSVKKSSRTVQ
jgi:hypothetical protein